MGRGREFLFRVERILAVQGSHDRQKSVGGSTATTQATRGTIKDGEVTTSKLATGALSADASGLAKMAAGFLQATADGLAKIADGFFTDTAGARAKFADGFVTAAKLAATLDLSGKTLTLPAANRSTIVQVVNTQTGALATGTTSLPFDDTIPQNTEGDEYMTLAITPTSATNKLLIEVIFIGTMTANGPVSVALFQDSTANALAAVAMHPGSASIEQTIPLRHYMTAGTTSATTFKVRAGAAGAATTTFNGTSGARKFGGVSASSITITEIKA